jgi:hypothetical protein
MVIKVSGGYKIKSHTTGKLYPKVYKTRAAAQKRIAMMEMFKSLEASGKKRSG